MSGNLPVMGSRGQGYRICRRIAIKMLVQQLYREEEVRFVDVWGCFVKRADVYMRNGLRLDGNSATVFADELSAAVDLFLVANIV